jgi:site-specific recombinase XerD
MERDLKIRGYSESTQYSYVHAVKTLVRHFMRSPELLTLDDINEYQRHLAERKLSWSAYNQIVCALRFFFGITLQKDWDIERIPYQKTGRKLPVVFSAAEILALLDAPSNIKHKAILSTLYAGGLRRSEALNLKVSDIDSDRMMVRIDQGKGKKDRYVPLSTRLLELLRRYWMACRPAHWLFPGQRDSGPLGRNSINKTFHRAKAAAGIDKPATLHTLRHSYATHLLESGVNLRVIQRLLGHRSIKSTEIYTHVAKNYVSESPSPLDLIGDPNSLVGVDDQ